MITLHEWPPTRSQRARWVLEELGTDYIRNPVDLATGAQDTEAHRALQPLGAVPAVQTSSFDMFESVAIVMQMIDCHPATGLAPAVGTPARAAYYQWCVFGAAELDPAVMTWFDNTMRPTEHGSRRDTGAADRGRQRYGERAAILSTLLADQDHMLADGFSGADIVIGHSCFMAETTGLIGDFPVLQVYHDRLKQRPAYQRAYKF